MQVHPQSTNSKSYRHCVWTCIIQIDPTILVETVNINKVNIHVSVAQYQCMFTTIITIQVSRVYYVHHNSNDQLTQYFLSRWIQASNQVKTTINNQYILCVKMKNSMYINVAPSTMWVDENSISATCLLDRVMWVAENQSVKYPIVGIMYIYSIVYNCQISVFKYSKNQLKSGVDPAQVCVGFQLTIQYLIMFTNRFQIVFKSLN